MKTFKGKNIDKHDYKFWFGGGDWATDEILPFEQDLINQLDEAINIIDNYYAVILTYLDTKPVLLEKELLAIYREYPHGWHCLWEELLKYEKDIWLSAGSALAECREYLPNFEPAVLTHLLNEYYNNNLYAKEYIIDKLNDNLVEKLNTLLKETKYIYYDEGKEKTKNINYSDYWGNIDIKQYNENIFYLENIFHMLQYTDFKNIFNFSPLFEKDYKKIDTKEKYDLIEQIFNYIVDYYFSEIEKLIDKCLKESLIIDTSYDGRKELNGFDIINYLLNRYTDVEYGTEIYDFHDYKYQFTLTK